MEVLAAGDTLAAWLRRGPPELDRRAAVDRCWISSVANGWDMPAMSRLRARALGVQHPIASHPYLFLAGLSEKVFPPAEREDRLYSEAEYSRLIDAGLPFCGPQPATREEMLLFYEAITRAGKRLMAELPGVGRLGATALAQPVFGEVEQAFGPGRIPRVERADLRPIPATTSRRARPSSASRPLPRH